MLAGGASTRFGGDKLAAELAGRPLLEHAITAVMAVAAEVIIAGGPVRDRVRPGAPSDPIHDATVRWVADREPRAGPLSGLLDAADTAAGRWLLVVGGDMPSLRPSLLARLLDHADGHAGAALVVDGWLQPLPVALDRGRVVADGSVLRAAGERSLRRLIERLDAVRLDEATWRQVDATGASLRDVDTVEDLAALESATPDPRTDR